jgi:hypothetical protein
MTVPTGNSILTEPRSLRRYHFHHKPRGRPNGDARRRRAGSAGGNKPSINVLKKYWLRPIVLANKSYGSDAGQEEDLRAELDDIKDVEDEEAEPIHDRNARVEPAPERAPQDHLDPVLGRKLRDCDVCGEEFPVAEFPIRLTRRCNHESKTCRLCVTQWIQSSLENSSLMSIKCPGASCKELLAHDDVRASASSEVFDRYSTFNDPDDIQVLPPQC